MVIIAALSIVFLQMTCFSSYGKEICVSSKELRICITAKGPCDIFHLIPTEPNGMKMDMFGVSVVNNSNVDIRISPHDFFSVTEAGNIIVIDRPFYDSIEIKTKLREIDLAPGGQSKGVLFFPSALGPIRNIVYNGLLPIFIDLY